MISNDQKKSTMLGVSIAGILLIVTSVVNTAKETDDLIVGLARPHGEIQGQTLESAKGKQYYAFKEIPYAAPPVGENRFKPPKPHGGWDGIRDATKNKKRCYQFHAFTPEWLQIGGEDGISMSEDCLFLNVYTPVRPGSPEALPVYFFIHGGAFAVGDGTSVNLDPKHLIDGGIVLVIMNYRLGPMGFLSIDGTDYSGNMALKDQHMALRWTYDNIHLFGGNPNDIVIGGQSSGAFAAGYHLLSSKTKGLVSAVIQGSGSPLSPAAYMSRAKSYALTLGRALDQSVTSDNTSHLIDTLIKASAEDIQTADLEVTNPHLLGFMVNPSWGPVVEQIEMSDKAFITTPMHQAFMQGNYNQVPALMGFNSQEAIFFLPHNSDSVLPEIADRIDSSPGLLVDQRVSPQNRTLEGSDIKDVYVPNSFKNNLDALVRYTGDVAFVHPIIRQAELTSKHVPVYLYKFASGDNTNAKFPGISHAADLKYFWGKTNTPEEETTRQVLLQLWWNFIKYKNPTPVKDALLNNVEWLPVQPDNIRYLNISDEMTMETNTTNYISIKAVLEKYKRAPYYTF